MRSSHPNRQTRGYEAAFRAVSGRAWLETLAACAVLIGVMAAAHGGPVATLVRPWLALVPAIVAVKHGLVPAGLALLAWGFAEPTDMEDFINAGLPVCAITALVGMFRDHWHRSRGTLRAAREEQEQQLELLFRRYSVLRASHAELEQRLAARDWSLDAALREAEKMVVDASFERSAGALLDLLVARGSVASASFFPAAAGRLASDPLASVGAAPSVTGSERILRTAYEYSNVVTADCSAPQAWFTARLNVLVALPVVSSRGEKVGVVAIHEIPFDKFNDEHVRMLTTLVLHFADPLSERQKLERAHNESGLHSNGVVSARVAETP